jgi:hypothetical protein
MNEQSEKELKMLIDKRWDPRRGVGKWLGTARYVFTGAFLFVLVFWRAFAITNGTRQFVAVHPTVFSQLFLLPIYGLIFCWVLPKSIRKRTREKAIKHNWFLCPWCRYALTDLPDEGICPECGAGYRRGLCASLYQCAYKSYLPDAVTLKKRESKLWREAIELRDGGRDG